MKHARKKDYKIEKQKKTLKVLLILLGLTLMATAATIYRDYQARPGFLKKIWISDRGADYITVAWEKPRNTYRYAITYNNKSIYVSGFRSEMRLTGLDEDTEYTISVRADSKKREGFEALTETARTKRTQSITGKDTQMKFVNTLVDLKMGAETDITYSSENKNMKVMGDKVMFTRPGKYNVTVRSKETNSYAADVKKITVEVLDSVNVDAEGADPHVFYKLNKKNCELIMNITGTKEARTPQSFVYSDGKYVVLYVGKNNKPQRIITFGDKRSVIKPKADLKHCNGLTISGDWFYEVNIKGPGCVSFDKSFEEFYSFDLPYDASGISFDPRTELFYVSQYKGMTTYDKEFNAINHFGRIKRSTKHYPQDCGSYAGIMMHCVSGPDFHGTNYIDFYDMLQAKYIGSIECELDEVESLIVDDEGYIELLCNTKKLEDCIWKTPINMKMLLD